MAELLFVAEYHQSLWCRENGDNEEEMSRLQKASDCFKTSSLLLDYPLIDNNLQPHQFAIKFGSAINDRLLYLKSHNFQAKTTELDDPKKNKLVKDYEFLSNSQVGYQEEPISQMSFMIEDSLLYEYFHIYPEFQTRKHREEESNVTFTADYLDELINVELKKVEEANIDLEKNLILECPPGIWFYTQEFPSDICEKASDVREKGGIEELQLKINASSDALNRIQKIWTDCDHLLNDASIADIQRRNQFKLRWTLVPFNDLTKALRTKAAIYREFIKKAKQVDKIVQQDFSANSSGIKYLSLDKSTFEQARVVYGYGQIQKSWSNTNHNILMKEWIQNPRNDIESKLKAIKINLQAMLSNDQSKGGEIIKKEVEFLGRQLEKDTQVQNAMIEDKKEARDEYLKKFMEQCETNKWKDTTSIEFPTDETIINVITRSYDCFIALYTNMQEAEFFYDKLTTELTNFQKEVTASFAYLKITIFLHPLQNNIINAHLLYSFLLIIP